MLMALLNIIVGHNPGEYFKGHNPGEYFKGHNPGVYFKGHNPDEYLKFGALYSFRLPAISELIMTNIRASC